LSATRQNGVACVDDTSCTLVQKFFCERGSGVSDATPPADTAVCNDGWIAKGTRCYRLITIKETAQYAKESCEYYGGELMRIRNYDEYLYLINFATTLIFFPIYVSFL
jgi:hypothetical protein